jgi:thioredoxin-disulfide reductase
MKISDDKVIYDVIIIGGAGAGLTAGIYSARRAMKTLIITKDIGGQALDAKTVENYPGFIKVHGPELMEKFQEQAVNSGAKIIYGTVTSIKEQKKEFVVIADEKEYRSKTVILSFGKTPRDLNVPGEKNLVGRGVSYCTICDGPLYKNKVVAMVGGGNSALEGVMYLSEIAKKVYLIHRRDEFRGFECFIDEVKKKKNVEIVLDSVVTEIKGKEKINSVLIKNMKTGKTNELALDGLFIEVGLEVKTDFVKDFVKLDESGHIVINCKCETYHPNSDKVRSGVFAAGDVTDTPFKQIIISAGEGCKAALQAYNYLHADKLRMVIDWSSLKK